MILNKLYILIAVMSVIGGAGYGVYYVYQNLQDQVIELTEQNAQLVEQASTKDNVINAQEETIRKQAENLERIVAETNRLNRALEASEQDLDSLRVLLIEHDLTRLAIEKPGLIERRINDATKNVFDQLERDTGAIGVPGEQ